MLHCGAWLGAQLMLPRQADVSSRLTRQVAEAFKKIQRMLQVVVRLVVEAEQATHPSQEPVRVRLRGEVIRAVTGIHYQAEGDREVIAASSPRNAVIRIHASCHASVT